MTTSSAKLRGILPYPRTLLVAASALLFVVVMALCIQSWHRGEQLYWSNGSSGWLIVPPDRPPFYRLWYFGIDLDHGRMAVYVRKVNIEQDAGASLQEPVPGGIYYRRREAPFPEWPFVGSRRWERLGFIWSHQALRAYGIIYDDFTFGLPLWIVCALTAIAPALWIRRRWRAVSRRRRGLCTGCGYDLRGSRDRCPECGQPAVIWPKQVAQSLTSLGRSPTHGPQT